VTQLLADDGDGDAAAAGWAAGTARLLLVLVGLLLPFWKTRQTTHSP
jgi:hypothetical protein